MNCLLNGFGALFACFGFLVFVCEVLCMLGDFRIHWWWIRNKRRSSAFGYLVLLELLQDLSRIGQLLRVLPVHLLDNKSQRFGSDWHYAVSSALLHQNRTTRCHVCSTLLTVPSEFLSPSICNLPECIDPFLLLRLLFQTCKGQTPPLPVLVFQRRVDHSHSPTW